MPSVNTPQPAAPPSLRLESDTADLFTLSNSQSDTVAVRPFVPNDAVSLSQRLTTAVHANLRDRIPWPYTLTDAQAWILICSDSSRFMPSVNGAIPTNYSFTVNDQCAGCIGLELRKEDKTTAELGYWLGDSYWRRGVMSLVIPAFVAWAFNKFETLQCLEAETLEWNLGSEAVLKRADFVMISSSTESGIKNGRPVGASLWEKRRSDF